MIFDFKRNAEAKAAQQQQFLAALYCNRIAEACAQFQKRSHHARLGDLPVAEQMRIREIAEHCAMLLADKGE